MWIVYQAFGEQNPNWCVYTAKSDPVSEETGHDLSVFLVNGDVAMTTIDSSVNEEPKDAGSKSSIFEENIKSRSTWIRLVYMVMYAFLFMVSEFVLCAVVVIQFIWRIVEGQSNEKLLAFGQSLASYLYQVIRFLTFNSDDLPFPLDGDWPSPKDDD